MYVCRPVCTVSEIKGAPCTRCAHFRRRVHYFRRCATFFELFIITTYQEGACRNSRVHSLGEVHPAGAQNKTLISDTVCMCMCVPVVMYVHVYLCVQGWMDGCIVCMYVCVLAIMGL